MEELPNPRVESGPPAWLRPLAWGCAATVLVLAVGLVWGACSLRQAAARGLERLSARVLAALPADTPEARREALRVTLACAAAAARRRAGERALGELVRACREALADARVSEEEMGAILAAAERACVPADGGP